MQIILRKRQMGKTTELIRISAETFAYMVVPTKNDVGKVFQMAKDMGLDIPFPLSYDEFMKGKRMRLGKREIRCHWRLDRRCLYLSLETKMQRGVKEPQKKSLESLKTIKRILAESIGIQMPIM